MAYYYTDSAREADPHAQPGVEVFRAWTCRCCGVSDWDAMDGTCKRCGDITSDRPDGVWFYAFGFPGCLWDSDPVGPFDSEAEALEAAREAAGVEGDPTDPVVNRNGTDPFDGFSGA